MMQATLAELAALVGGHLSGDGNLPIQGASPLSDAKPGDITLIDRPERFDRLDGCAASAAVAPPSVAYDRMPLIRVDDVHHAFSVIVARFRPRRSPARVGVSPLAVVSDTAQLGANVDVHPLATVGDDVTIGAGSTIHSGARIMAGCRISEDVTIFPGAVLYEDTAVGPRCVIHAGVVLGAYGFGYCCENGRHQISAQLGNVILESDVEIGANSTVDRGTYGPTVIGEGTKIDNQVMIAHNCRLGKHNMICAQVGIAGSTSTGDYVVMAGQVGVRDHVHIGAGAVLGAMSGVMCDIPAGARMVGIPATPEREQMVQLAALGRLPEMRRELKQLHRTVEKLVGGNGPADRA